MTNETETTSIQIKFHYIIATLNSIYIKKFKDMYMGKFHNVN